MTHGSRRTRIGGTPIAPEDPASRTEWRAAWLQDPVFEGTEFRELIDPGRREELNGEIQNIHTLFRREWVLPDMPIERPRLYITADDCYKLYINGRYVGVGPAPAYPFDYPYNAWDVGDLLKSGEPNCIGVHVFYQGMHSLPPERWLASALTFFDRMRPPGTGMTGCALSAAAASSRRPSAGGAARFRPTIRPNGTSSLARNSRTSRPCSGAWPRGDVRARRRNTPGLRPHAHRAVRAGGGRRDVHQESVGRALAQRQTEGGRYTEST